jgi:uncharacterized protein with von Willebrand factor type A (vWA) domain
VTGEAHTDGDAFTHNLVHFVRYMRSLGLPVGPGVAGELGAAIDAVGLDDRTDLYLAMRACVITRPTQGVLFDEAFDLFFGSGRGGSPDLQIASEHRRPDRADARPRVPVLAPPTEASEEREIEELEEIAGGSHAETLSNRDFAELGEAELEQVRMLIDRMTWRPADAPSRRWAPLGATRPDLRRTLRGLTGPQGDLMPLALSDRRMRKRPLIVIADISGSMERYTELFLYFIHAAQGRLGRVESFVFATRLTRITREMRLRRPQAALAQVGRHVDDWSGGTRIGEAFAEFNRTWSRRVTGGGPIGLVISDGWDTGDPELLDVEMGRFARSVHRVVWLNPLAGRAGFAPETRGMRTVLRHVDDFLPAGSLADLRAVVRLLESIPSRRTARR